LPGKVNTRDKSGGKTASARSNNRRKPDFARRKNLQGEKSALQTKSLVPESTGVGKDRRGERHGNIDVKRYGLKQGGGKKRWFYDENCRIGGETLQG